MSLKDFGGGGALSVVQGRTLQSPTDLRLTTGTEKWRRSLRALPHIRHTAPELTCLCLHLGRGKKEASQVSAPETGKTSGVLPGSSAPKPEKLLQPKSVMGNSTPLTRQNLTQLMNGGLDGVLASFPGLFHNPLCFS
ncbi:hypothetical protein P4O66_010115 [Electrophorus voltai]|uniref:Uncharacterized protein n=1 Tax=Electrophorus voltai TaxID=2609070 RepID=A0AAD8ZBJ8_9TELE|nr:hypothetical protein P4O66_010115 [Electrophorus voltai]